MCLRHYSRVPYLRGPQRLLIGKLYGVRLTVMSMCEQSGCGGQQLHTDRETLQFLEALWLKAEAFS